MAAQAIQLEVMMLLEHAFANAKEADEYLREQAGTTNLDRLSDKECRGLLARLKQIAPPPKPKPKGKKARKEQP